MTKVAVVGAGGRMGRTIVACICRGMVPGVELSGALEAAGDERIGSDAGEIAGAGACGILISDDGSAVAGGADVLVDFSFHAAVPETVRLGRKHGCGLVIGTTGLSDEERSVVEAAARELPIVMAPNMSFGVNLLRVLVGRVAEALTDKGYDIEVIERHHRRKKDAPSGTALGLAEAAAEGMGVDLESVAVYGRRGMVGQRPAGQIGIHAVRGGDIVGDHEVLFAGDGEYLQLVHRATSREAFAVGALRAAVWVHGREPGLYDMLDVLELRGR